MRAVVRAIAALLFVAACAPRYKHVVDRQLRSTGGLECPGYLVWNEEPVRDVFLVIGGSGNLSNAFVHPAFEDSMRTHQVAYSTYDKPGIWAPFGDPAAVRRDDAVFERYTLGHGTACAIDALRWAREHFGASVRLHMAGHSEGTLVALYAYEAALDEDPALAAQLRTLVLSGLALEPIAEIFERQLAELRGGDHIRAAFASCDQSVINESPFAGTSCAYLEDAAGRPSGRAMFERLATRSPTASFHIVHGEADLNTPVRHVRALEAWNAGAGHLPITFHYVEGGHTDNAAARAEVTRLVMAIVSEGVTGSSVGVDALRPGNASVKTRLEALSASASPSLGRNPVRVAEILDVRANAIRSRACPTHRSSTVWWRSSCAAPGSCSSSSDALFRG